MANPVLDRITKNAERTPAGYPTMPGYRVGQTTSNPYNQQAMSHSETQWDESQWDATYAGPSADAVDRGVMTYDDVLVKTGLSFGAVIVAASIGWFLFSYQPAIAMIAMGVGVVSALGIAIASMIVKSIGPGLTFAYAASQGVALGVISAVMELQYTGIVIQALLATFAVFGVTLALFASGKVRNSPKLARFALIALIGLLVYRLLNAILVWTGVLSGGGLNDATIMGMPLGIVVGFLAVFIGAICLIQDFDQVQRGVQAGAPARFAWACAFGLTVTIIWMYLEILQLLARLRD